MMRRLPVLPAPRRPFARVALVVAATGFMSAAAVPAHAAGTFSVTSADFSDGGVVGMKQVLDSGNCHGGNHSPQLSWSHPPVGTRSFAVTMFDQDAPGRGWWHWAVAGIPARVLSLPENASGSGYLAKLGAIEARNDFDADGYGGPCPPPGKPHRYVVTVYALNTEDPGVAQGRPAQMFDREIRTSSLGSATLTVTYGR
jgi:Raf kinase inhibitor-like YbhB/YbcL family protein